MFLRKCIEQKIKFLKLNVIDRWNYEIDLHGPVEDILFVWKGDDYKNFLFHGN